MTPADSARIATKVFMDDLRERKGFGELIASISDWPDIEAFMQKKVERELEQAAQPTEQDIAF